MFEAALKDALQQIRNDNTAVLEIVSNIHSAYSEQHRYYHNFTHLENIYSELFAVKDECTSFIAIIFAIAWHDVIYDTSRHNNEERSAEYASEELMKLNADKNIIGDCTQFILATKSHQQSENSDCNLFCDADLSILGADENTYLKYASAIRKEYSIYPDEVYYPGRMNVLQKFVEMKSIFKTAHFKEKYEELARRNVDLELKIIKSSRQKNS